jgi:hypothetical protein
MVPCVAQVAAAEPRLLNVAIIHCDRASVCHHTQQIDSALEATGAVDDSAADAVTAGHRVLAGADDSW